MTTSQTVDSRHRLSGLIYFFTKTRSKRPLLLLTRIMALAQLMSKYFPKSPGKPPTAPTLSRATQLRLCWETSWKELTLKTITSLGLTALKSDTWRILKKLKKEEQLVNLCKNAWSVNQNNKGAQTYGQELFSAYVRLGNVNLQKQVRYRIAFVFLWEKARQLWRW